MAEEFEDDVGFPNETINQIVLNTAESVLENAQWDEKKVPGWINEICETVTKQLIEMKRPYKYIVNCMLIQKTDKPLYSCLSARYENNVDGIENVVYPAPRQQKELASKTIQCLATVIALKF
uniref:Uncharacterized protein n=1 Tax=Strombidium rassoulzadegani TaxID=1082188 RepID=A0A7S3CPD7_9SPIT|mmetsp:Transcript_1975/g.3472  ORF Transcript_1975/g.3472 Transcript_1975/m.3472 type:complete len:122 (+) Transcript_1975:25-390(+)